MSESLGADYGWLDQATDNALGLAASEELAYIQSLARRLMTPNGSIKYWKNYGTDLRQFLLDDPPNYIVASAAEAECYKDERTQLAQATIERIEGEMFVTLDVETGSSAFRFVMSVAEAETKLVSMQKAA